MGTTDEERESDAQQLARLIPAHTVPLGRGGLDPSETRSAVTWSGAFQRARENQSRGESGMTYISGGRSSGER